MRYMTPTLALLVSVALTGCFDVELEVPVLTQVATVEGNQALNKANATLHGEVLDPARVTNGFGLGDQPMEHVHLADFSVRVTDDALDGPADIDDLEFIDSMVVYVGSLEEDSALKDVAVAWYYRDEAPDSDDRSLHFEVDSEMDLKPYLEEGFELFTKSVSRVPADDVSVEGLATFTIVPGI